MAPGCGGASFVPSGRDGVFWGEGDEDLGQMSPLLAAHLSQEKIELWFGLFGWFFFFFDDGLFLVL